MLKRFALSAIRRYQANGGAKAHFNISCNFTPSCSEYTYQAIEKYGFFKGVRIGFCRIRRCNDPDCIEVKSESPTIT
ncbi:membrane protein insertion efficiency factor YidD [Pseudoalteromonas maricaloris]